MERPKPHHGPSSAVERLTLSPHLSQVSTSLEGADGTTRSAVTVVTSLDPVMTLAQQRTDAIVPTGRDGRLGLVRPLPCEPTRSTYNGK